MSDSLTSHEISYRSGLDYSSTTGLEPSPSGSASGLSLEDAACSALMELIERDAVMVAWARQLVLDELSLDSDTWGSPQLTFMTGFLNQLERTVRIGRCRTGVPGVDVYLAATFSEGDRLCGFGAKASTTPSEGVLGALFEACQLYDVLGLARTWTDIAVVEKPRNDEERARYWSLPHASTLLQGWFDTFNTVEGSSQAEERLMSQDLARFMCDDGAESVFVADLTGRLPNGAREIGWHAVKAFASGYQQLRLDERRHDTWNASRLARAEERTGHASSLDSDRIFPIPHPLV
ncbi:YcaO-like family protein [Arthrobacter sp. RAF14]|uniref:YcaO-like family protein n=1 Tax=Arthrobacter sp. RAF14 TaxID=3233051 RepID=UPI003F8E0FFE